MASSLDSWGVPMIAKLSPKQNRRGFTLLEIMVVVLIIGVLLMIAIPAWVGARERSQARTCQSQLREIRYAKEAWGMDNQKKSTDTPTMEDLYPAYLKKQPFCPAGGEYTIGDLSTDPTCSIGGNHVLEPN